MIPGYVLAGGASRRMGRDKALLPIDGEPLAARTARVLQESGCAPVALVGRQPELTTLGLPVITEPAGVRHPLIGVATALRQADSPLALLTPCDLPRLTAAAVRCLLAAARPCRALGQPLLCILPTSDARRALEHAQRGGSAREFVASLPAISVSMDALLNLNTPMDLDRVR